MDSNNQQQPPVVNSIPVTPPAKKGGTLTWVIIIVVVVAVAGVAYWYLTSQGKLGGTPSTTTEVESLNSELNALNQDDVDSDFTAIDQDLKNL